MEKIETHGLKILSWAKDPDQGCLEQARRLAQLPFAVGHIALMPDTHQGFGMPVGGVLATDGVIIPNAVGVDIGCGMQAVKTNITTLDEFSVKAALYLIKKHVPVGFNRHKSMQKEELMPSQFWGGSIFVSDFVCEDEYDNARTQLGTLGGGNHFIEIQRGDDGFYWLMIHSGSRNLGKQVAEHYNKVAIELNKKWSTSTPPSWDLAHLPLDSKEGTKYFAEMNYCIKFAKANRDLMMARCMDALNEVCGRVVFSGAIDIAHNYAAVEEHFGRKVVVHRKGATKASLGLTGIIPGSMGSSSYIVEGLGSKASMESCSHGAGRVLARNVAKKTLSLEEEVKKLNDMGVVHELNGEDSLDEAPGAYKDIDEVMELQKDLVKIVTKLTPVGVVKG